MSIATAILDLGPLGVFHNPSTTDGCHRQAVAPNVLPLMETLTAPNQVWVTEFSGFQRSLIWLGRYGAPDDVVAAVTFPASTAIRHIPGTIINVDGGTLA